jgi:hypothetical protein
MPNPSVEVTRTGVAPDLEHWVADEVMRRRDP